MPPARLVAAEQEYSRCYCEENVWRLLHNAASTGETAVEDWFAVWLSSQVIRPEEELPGGPFRSTVGVFDGLRIVRWDYHVVAVHSPPGEEAEVFDMDSRKLGWPLPAAEWCVSLSPEFQRMPCNRALYLRFCPAADYLRTFASDRRHMRDRRGGWKQAPPPNPCIQPLLQSGEGRRTP
eukprot:TRINITY_DN9604_c0_g2_i3.p1 TRINITY_DN9604_c0_g2~~TRINITY_DN9604_c0_g2_i3.p1  ORF type:complete len:197 (+),score=44.60 TRINITY_DN9604_c0_g2_i3:55-591(+)